MSLSTCLKSLAIAAIISGSATAAHAGEWRLNPAACPDLVEDRYDRRVTYSRADLREDYRDARQVNCPASAWSYVPTRGEYVARSVVYSGPTVVYVDPVRAVYAPVVNVRPAPVVRRTTRRVVRRAIRH